MLGLGVATVCLSIRSHFVGSGYLSPAAYTAIYLGPSLFALRRGGLDLVFGMTITAGFIQLGVAPLLKRLRALLPSEIAGLVIAILGLALASIGVQYSLGIDNGQPIKPDYVIVAGASLVTMSVLNIWTKGYGKMFCVLIGMVVGYITSFAVGILDFEPYFGGKRRANLSIAARRSHRLVIRHLSAGAVRGRGARRDSARDGRHFECATLERFRLGTAQFQLAGRRCRGQRHLQ